MRVDELWLRSSDVPASHRFLDKHFPTFNQASGTGPARMRFLESGSRPAQLATDDELASFWKVSIFCDDVDRTRASLVTAGTEVTQPVQFGEIGFLCHLVEPGANEVELLQRSFKGSVAPAKTGPDSFGLVTLRITDPDASHRFYTDALGLTLLATMAVDDGRPDPFDLYFYGDGSTAPPDPDPSAVANREWLYQRPFTIIELQHYRDAAHHSDAALHPDAASSPVGLHSIRLKAESLEIAGSRLAAADCEVARAEGSDGGSELHFNSPDGHRYVCTRQD